jgi:dihydroneopterin aldolase
VADTWNGQELPARAPLHVPLSETVHYRLYDRATRKVLSFNSTNSFDSLVEDIAATQREHPDARVIAVRYDGPAYT